MFLSLLPLTCALMHCYTTKIPALSGQFHISPYWIRPGPETAAGFLVLVLTEADPSFVLLSPCRRLFMQFPSSITRMLPLSKAFNFQLFSLCFSSESILSFFLKRGAENVLDLSLLPACKHLELNLKCLRRQIVHPHTAKISICQSLLSGAVCSIIMWCLHNVCFCTLCSAKHCRRTGQWTDYT